MARTSAYWITPAGEILKPDSYHIGSVIKMPSKFGTTTEKLKKIFDKYGEKYSPFAEGKAREEIISDLLKKKFIRIRQNVSGSYTIQVNTLTPKMNDYIWEWANKESKDTFDKFADVNIHILKGNKIVRTSLDRLASGETIKESRRGILTEEECNNIRVFTDSDISEMRDYFDYAEEYIDEHTDQWVIDEILENKYRAMVKHLK
jgi:hypothetical protein